MSKHACKGTVLKQYISGSYVAVAQVMSVDRNDVGGNSWDATDLDSTWQEKGAAIPDAGSTGWEVFYDPQLAGHQAIRGAHSTQTNWRIAYADGAGSNEDFTSAVLKTSVSVKVNDGLKMSVKTENTGAATLP